MAVEHPVLCLDYGEARIGVAATDVMGIAVHAVESVNARNEPIVRIAELVRERQVKQAFLWSIGFLLRHRLEFVDLSVYSGHVHGIACTKIFTTSFSGDKTCLKKTLLLTA